MTLFTLVFIIGIILFFFLKDRNKMLETQIDIEGGILEKYSEIINYLTNNPNAKITQRKRDFVEISYILNSTSTIFYITEVFGGVEIKWLGKFGVLGNHNLSWFFNHPIKEEDIIFKIMSDIEKYEKEKLS